jgi:DnaJ-class molecular chaperone
MDVTFYGDFKRFTAPLAVVSLDEVAGEIACPDCEGTGDVSQYMPEGHPERCVTCKGTGRVLVSI